jgi:hypothetical protein
MIPVVFMAMSLAGAGNAEVSAGSEPANGLTGCVPGGDGYFRAHLAGAIDADIDWPDNGTVCQGEAHGEISLTADSAGAPGARGAPGALRDGVTHDTVVPAGVRLSFRRSAAARPNLLFVFGISGVREGKPLRAAGANLTIIVQGTSHIYSTRGDARCTVDSLTQRALADAHRWRLEVRGFCTQPAHAVRGNGAVLVSRFDFAGSVDFAAGEAAP